MKIIKKIVLDEFKITLLSNPAAVVHDFLYVLDEFKITLLSNNWEEMPKEEISFR